MARTTIPTKMRATKVASKKRRTKRVSAKPKKASKRESGTCFVLTPFKEPFNTYYSSIIEPAVVSAGLVCKRGDSLFGPSPIMGDVWMMIQDATVIVAELTEKNANVFYELGLSHAIGKPVVLVSETIADVPFDLQSLRVILYDKDNPAWGQKLRADLSASLKETLSDPVRAVPTMYRKVVESQAPEDSEVSLRLSTLEQRVASLQRESMNPTGSISSRVFLDRFRRTLAKAANRSEVVEAINKAFEAGVAQAFIEAELRLNGMHPNTIRDMLLEAAFR